MNFFSLIKKKILITITLLCSMIIGFGQTKIAELTFEGVPTDLAYTTSYSDGTNFPEFTNGNLNYFTRTDGSNIGPAIVLANQQGSFYFGAQNIDDDPDVAGQIPLLLNIDDIDISGYTDLEFRVHLAEDDDNANEDWDNTFSHDYVHFNYDIDNTGTFNNLLWIETTTAFLGNQAPLIDTDFDGVGDGTEITDTFSQFVWTFPVTALGSFLDVQIEFSLNLSQEDIAIDNIEIWGIPTAPPEIDYCNIQFPNTTQNIDFGDNFDVYAQVYEPGITDLAGEGTAIDAWIGYNTIDNDPVANDATWIWIPATYNSDSVNNDEYLAEIGSGLAVGTYYYASRFTLNSGTTYVYGGSAGVWNNDSVQLIVNPHEVDWCNLQYPPSTTINFGDSFDVYGRVYEPSVTDTPAIQGAGINAWVGFSTIDATTATDFTATDWSWVPANYNTLCPDCNDPTNTVENNDEYFVDIGPNIPGSGTYYYVTRFQLNGGPFSYGGYTAPVAPNPSGGGFWDGITNISQILTVTDNCASTAIWDGLNWTPPVAPDTTTEVILNGTYDTDLNGNFEACSLDVRPNFTLNIRDGHSVKVINDINVDGTILASSEASLVQVNDAPGNITVGVTGDCILEKSTNPIDDWFDYTYWSSPVSNETIESVFQGVPVDRIYKYDASNFDDSDGDTFDDNGNDWIIAGQTETLTQGKGYAAVADVIGMLGIQTFSFNGTFNNGIITPSITVSGGANPQHWNFLGNPYPSAIDADLFLTHPSNTTINGTIHFWTHNSDPDGIYDGIDALNFTSADYASYNLIGGVGTQAASSNGSNNSTVPTGLIASGQGFFVEGLPPAGVVTFNNSMRVTSGNDNFYRMGQNSQRTSSVTTDRVWLNLQNEHGAFSQILIGFNEFATYGVDRLFDGKRLSANNYITFYSLIENEKFAIQGLAPFTEETIIPIGLNFNIEEELPYSISIDNVEGILASSQIYLKDNLLDIEHNLSDSAYVFTSEVGEFNDRFEIRFATTLEINEFEDINDQLIVNSNEQNELEFSTTNRSVIANIKIYDLLGRQLHDLNNNNQTFVSLNTKAMSNSVYIVKVELLNGVVLTKKVLKQ